MASLGFILLCAITFISAFLLFQIELIIAKLFLPTYGGSYLVWGACVVFFQAALLVGYVFAHRWIKQQGVAKYLKTHLILLVLPFLFFPRTGIHVSSTISSLPLVLDVFLRLLTTIGPVFFVLSTISLVTQSWLLHSKLTERSHPYILYAVSNIGSFAALWSYPFVVEYFLTNTQQINIWRILYVVLVILNIIAFKIIKTSQAVKEEAENTVPVTRQTALRWLVLSAAAVVLFLSVTNLITYEVAPVPLLWILPLSIYLLSFVLIFKNKPWFPKGANILAVAMIFLGVLLYFEVKLTFLTAGWAIILFNIVLFVLCLFAQHELIKSKPASGQLTLFYVMISLGGFIGGFLTSWIVPLISHAPIEFLIGMLLIAMMYRRFWVRVMLIIVVATAMIADQFINVHGSFVRKRNYYGIYEVYDTKSNVRSFVHGTTLHGIEWNIPERRFIPLGYYSPNAPMGQVLIKNIFEAHRVGAVGLGAGTMAMYTRPDLAMDFYELDPDVVSIARNYFWYLSLAPGLINVQVGDARVSLAKMDENIYDLLVIDAFGGDAVPFHLINRDVVEMYRKHITARGGILFHIPNRYFNLEGVLAHIAYDLGAYAAVKEALQDGITLRTYWAVITWDKERYDRLVNEEGWRPMTIDKYKPLRTWTDDFSTSLPILKFDEIYEGLKHFKLF